MDEHGTAITTVEHAPVERMAPVVQAMLSAGQALDTAAIEKMMELNER